eukprot:372822_1
MAEVKQQQEKAIDMTADKFIEILEQRWKGREGELYQVVAEYCFNHMDDYLSLSNASSMSYTGMKGGHPTFELRLTENWESYQAMTQQEKTKYQVAVLSDVKKILGCGNAISVMYVKEGSRKFGLELWK